MRLVLTLSALTIATLGLVGCKGRSPASASQQTSKVAQVRVVTLTPQPFSESIRTHGVVEAAEEVKITIDFPAVARRVNFKEGERVEAGAVLMEFDRKKRNLLLRQARTGVADARARLDQARALKQRRAKLYKARAVSHEQLEAAETLLRSAKAHYNEAVAAKRLAQHSVKETTLVSPVSGLVAKRAVEAGETVMAGQILAVVQAVDTVRVVTWVTEKDINALQVGGKCSVTTPGVRGRTYEARIESLGAKADPRTGNFPVHLTVQNTEGLLRVGMTARVVLEGLVYDDALLVPAAALVDRNRRRVVFKVVDTKAIELEPVLAATTGDSLPVLDGLEEGDQLVVDGLESVVNGSKVQVVMGGE